MMKETAGEGTATRCNNDTKERLEIPLDPADRLPCTRGHRIAPPGAARPAALERETLGGHQQAAAEAAVEAAAAAAAAERYSMEDCAGGSEGR
ncbi:hypothetical protein NL676_007611 [Syzygium grande]|nr:hypothetical protein NL676_007611 [Syzygium grande]